jgi:replicative DNA helicase
MPGEPSPAGRIPRLDRSPPHSEEAERGVLGSVLLDSARVLDLCIEAQLGPDSFYIPAHRLVMEAMLDMSRDGRPVDSLTITERMRAAGTLDKSGGPLFLDGLIEATPTSAHAEYYIDIVRQKHLLRAIIDKARRAESACYGDTLEASAVLSAVEQSFFDIGADLQRGTVTRWGDAVVAVMQQVEHFLTAKDGVNGLATGFRNLDKVLGGMRNSNMIILAARPSMGKTSLAMNIAQNVALGRGMGDRRPRAVAVFSLEMSKEELVLRMLCTEAQVSMSQVTSGMIARNGEEHTRLDEASKRLFKAPIYIDDSAGLDINEIRARARRLKKKFGVDLVVIDYLQLLHSQEYAKQGRQVEISTVSGGIKSMAKELKVPVLCLSQLSRATETRDKLGKPKLSDLRDSGSIEQDADVVLLLRRPCKYPDDDESGDPLLAIVDVAKSRNGPTHDDVRFNFIDRFTLFQDRDDMHRPEPPGGRADAGGEE